LSYVSTSWSKIPDKLAINWQNFVARVRLQLKFAFIIRLKHFLYADFTLFLRVINNTVKHTEDVSVYIFEPFSNLFKYNPTSG